MATSGRSSQELLQLNLDIQNATNAIPALESNVLNSNIALNKLEANVLLNADLTAMQKATLQTEGLASVRGLYKPITSDPWLSLYFDETLYKEGASVGSGSTADAVREKIRTGRPVNNLFHSQKAREAITALQRWLIRSPTASASDRSAAQAVINDMQHALNGD